VEEERLSTHSGLIHIPKEDTNGERFLNVHHASIIKRCGNYTEFHYPRSGTYYGDTVSVWDKDEYVWNQVRSIVVD